MMSTTNTPAPTPETDALGFNAFVWNGDGYSEESFIDAGESVPAHFARRLERERDELREAVNEIPNNNLLPRCGPSGCLCRGITRSAWSFISL